MNDYSKELGIISIRTKNQVYSLSFKPPQQEEVARMIHLLNVTYQIKVKDSIAHE